jgi:hypothetical protein
MRRLRREAVGTACALALFHALLVQRQRFGRIGFRAECAFVEADFLLAFQTVRHIIADLIYGIGQRPRTIGNF